MLSSFALSIAATLLADVIFHAHSDPSSTWSTTYYHDGRSRPLFRRSLYRRGGSDENGMGHLEQLSDANETAASVLSSFVIGEPCSYSTCSVQGERQYMEDEYFVEQGRFAAVFDGHGGRAVSRYLRQNLYANFQAALPTSASSVTNDVECGGISPNEETTGHDIQSTILASALETAFDKVDSEVGSISHWSFQGSTALAVVIHENVDDGTKSIISANVGDSRAVISRNRIAIDLTKDHKPNDKAERERIEALDGTVDWCGSVDSRGRPVEHTGVYRINGNLALSRAIGDRSERPWVTNSVDISHHLIDEENDSFVVLATDGLFDVMTSQEVVEFVHEIVDSTPPEHRRELRREIAKYVVEEALQRGTSDNVTVVVLWINEEK